MENDDKLTMTVETAGRLLGVSRSTAFKLANEGVLPVLRLGRRLVVPKAAFALFLASAKSGARDGEAEQ